LEGGVYGRKARSILLVLAIACACPCVAAAQELRGEVKVLVPAGVPSEKLAINYYLEGPFGGYEPYVWPAPNSPAYVFSTVVNGKQATSLKMAVSAPGCETKIFQRKLPADSRLEIPYLCEVLPTIKLSGRIEPLALVHKDSIELSVRFQASWLCNFFRLADCMVPQIDLGSVIPDDKGMFQLDLPDVTADPVLVRYKYGENSGEFDFTLRSGSWSAELKPALESLQGASGRLKPRSAYPSDLIFVLNEPERSLH
jgi:hypothetical protein